MKKLLSMLLVLVMLLSLVPAGFAEEINIVDYEDGELGLRTEQDDDLITLVDPDTDPQDYELPQTGSSDEMRTPAAGFRLDGQGSEPLRFDPQPVVQAEEKSYQVSDTITAVLSADGVLTVTGTGEIPNYSSDNELWYPDRYNVKSAVIGSGITAVGEGNFYGCYNMKTVNIAATVTMIRAGAFANSGLNQIIGMSGLKTLENYAFQNCEFESFSFPSKVETIGDYVFYGCYKLKSITIPASATQIGTVGYGASALESISVNSANPAYQTKNGVLMTRDGTELISYPPAKTGSSYSIPSSVKTVKAYAFSDQQNLQTVKIPGTVTALEDGAFRAMPALTALEIPASVTTLGMFLVENCTALQTLTVKAKAEVFDYCSAQGCSSLTTVRFDTDTIRSIDARAFADCSSLKNLTLPSKLSSIIVYAFYNCTQLTSVSFPSSITYIQGGAFYNSGITSFPSWLTALDNGDYRLLTSLTVSGYYDYPLAYDILALVNRERNKEGLAPLTMDKDLLEAAMLRAAETAVDFSHTRPSGASCFSACSKMSGENIAAGTSTPESTMNLWMNSSGHRSNILNSSFTSIGIGCIKTSNGYGIYWTQCFGRDAADEPDSIPSSHSVEETVLIEPSRLTENALKLTVAESDSEEKNFSLSILYNSYFPVSTELFAFSSDRPEAATVTNEGKVKRIGSGSFTISAALAYDPYTKLSLDFDYGPVLTEAFNSATGVRVSWKPLSTAAKYQLLRKNLTLGETQWKVVGETTDCTLIDTTAKSSNRYTYTVRTVDAYGNVGPFDETGRTCTFIALANITTLRYGVKGVSLTWSKPAGAKNFRVMRREDGTSKWTVLAVIEGTTYTDTTAKIGTKYWYTVRGVSMDNKVVINSYNGTGWSMKPLSTPVLTEAFNSATGVRVSWKAVDGAAKYRLLRKDVNAGTGWETIGTTAACTLIDTSAKSASRYTYTVECVDSNGRTCSTSDSTGRTCTFIALAKITSIKSVSNGVALEWSKPAGAKNFRILRKVDGGAWEKLTDIQGTSYTDTTAKVGVKYWYTVRAITLAGDMYINSYNATGWSVTRT